MNRKQTKARQIKKTAKSTESFCAIYLFQVISGRQLPLFFKLKEIDHKFLWVIS